MNRLNIIELACDLIKTFEGFRSEVYVDSAGIPTIGYGTTKINGEQVEFGMENCTENEALKWLRIHVLKDYDKLVMWCHAQNPLSIILSDNQAASILSFTYNAGWNSFLSSSMAKWIIEGDYNKAAQAFEKWNKIRKDGKLVFSKGLFNRRMKEQDCFIDEEKCKS